MLEFKESKRRLRDKQLLLRTREMRRKELGNLKRKRTAWKEKELLQRSSKRDKDRN